ncbi:RSP_7527 family protein [Aliiroseovarius sp. 2305UL8-7]|uniref:RSP_7527 family protein n=1 Tax=Aliiroseovarius conchicola TaxID=3121637 RepID=UPI0035271407
MEKNEFTFPTQDEINDIIRDAQQMRAEAFAGWLSSAWTKVFHRRSISVTTDRVPAEMPL